MDKPFSWKSLDGTQGFDAVLHLGTWGAFKSADVTCGKMVLVGLTQDQFLQLCYEGIGERAASYDVPETSVSPTASPL